jgi:hypothetical protein
MWLPVDEVRREIADQLEDAYQADVEEIEPMTFMGRPLGARNLCEIVTTNLQANGRYVRVKHRTACTLGLTVGSNVTQQ